MGYAFCLGVLVNTEDNRNLVFKPFHPEIKVNLCIATKKYQNSSKAVKIFIDRLQIELTKST